ncbi:unnamed protein product [Adineta steineri]|uniref:Uncharacterized protein n=1 Tax=Adineta steineri TaxID=433720 RepID=A0A818UDT9_9BILA|nr:unnamed protein product [Adineta steineri]CAF3699222.1 unnamed protein product [Adineta steineri]
MNRKVFLNLLKNSDCNETSLDLLRNNSMECLDCDTRLRDRMTNDVQFSFWDKKIKQSTIEIKIIDLIINYINGGIRAVNTVPIASPSDTAPPSNTDA